MPGRGYLSDVFVQTLEQAIDGVVVIGHENQIIFINKAAERLWGYSREEALGQNVRLLVPHDIKPQHDHYIQANRHTGINKIVGTSRDVPIEHKDGRRKWGSMSISRMQVNDQILYTAFIKDVTRQHEDNERLRLLSMVADKTGSAILITDAHWRIIYVNSGATDLLGYSAAELTGRYPADLVVVDDNTENTIRQLQQALKAGQSYNADELITIAAGERLWCNVTINPVLDADNGLMNAVIVMVDITHNKIHETLQQKMLDAMVREKPLHTLMALACKEISRLAPEITAAVLRMNDDHSLHVLAAPDLPETYGQVLNGIRVTTETFVSTELTETLNDVLWLKHQPLFTTFGLQGCWSIAIKSSDQRVMGLLVLYYHDQRQPSVLHRQLAGVIVSLCALAFEREQNRLYIRQLAYYDNLTELPNRSLLHSNAEHLLLEAALKSHSVAVLFIDLDRFKQVNDSMGHSAGDELLRLIASRLQQSCRRSDIVGRLSGDEFVVILPQCSAEHVSELAEKLRQAISDSCLIAGKKLNPSACIGISLFPQDGADISTLLQRADMAMYQAKTSGRGKVSFFSYELNRRIQEHQQLESALRYALEHNELELHYQPQIKMHNGTLYGVEALARWRHAELGNIAPSRFIPLAEECGLIDELGIWAITEACRQLSRWRKKGLNIPAISVNLSPTNFRNTDLPKMIVATLQQFQLSVKDLTLELTEDVLLDTHAMTMKTLSEVYELGIRLAMDDFGTGYSSLSYLRRLPIHELKLDRSFVQGLSADDISQTISDAVLKIGESLQLMVVAEGIEEEPQFHILRQQGYHVAQGYFLSAALPVAGFEQWLQQRYQDETPDLAAE